MTAVAAAPGAAAPPAAQLRQQPAGPNPWLVAITVTMATFMEVLDTSIANVALPHIGGSLSATTDEVTWVLTSYLVANAIVLPLSAWLSDIFGRKRFYMTCVALFTISSMLCGLAPNLGMLVFFRVLQGIGGGGLQPSEQAILADTFPPKKRGMAFAVYGFAVVAAPAIGPTLGGWITDNVSWRWIFYINIPIGIVSLILTHRLVQDPPKFLAEQRHLKKKGFHVDYVGLGLITIGLGCLQIVLDKGQREDWFASNFILWLSIIAGVGIVAAIVWEWWFAKFPIVDLHLFKERNFAIASAILFMIGLVLFSSTVLLPLMLQTLFNYTALDAGLVLSPGAVLIMLAMPVVGFLLQKVEPRWLIVFALVVCSFGLYLMSGFTTQTDLKTFILYRCVQAGALGFLFVPVNTAMYAYIPPGKNNNASALVNLARNVGGSVGISLVTTFLDRRSQFHQSRVGEHLTAFNPSYHDAMAKLTHYFSGHSAAGAASHQANGLLYQLVRQQAGMLAYVDCYFVLAIAFAVMIPFVFLLKPTRGRGAMGGH